MGAILFMAEYHRAGSYKERKGTWVLGIPRGISPRLWLNNEQCHAWVPGKERWKAVGKKKKKALTHTGLVIFHVSTSHSRMTLSFITRRKLINGNRSRNGTGDGISKDINNPAIINMLHILKKVRRKYKHNEHRSEIHKKTQM